MLGPVHARLRLALIALTLCAIAAVAGVTLAGRTGVASQPVELANGWAGAQRPQGLDVPTFTLRDQDGKPVSSASLTGRPTLYAFIYSTCQDTCPAEVQTIRGTLDDTHSKANVIGISVDPRNDTPARAKTFLVEQHMTGRMRYLLGTQAQLAPIWKQFGIVPQTTGAEHTAHIVIADARGRQLIGFPFATLTQPGLDHDLRRIDAQPTDATVSTGAARLTGS